MEEISLVRNLQLQCHVIKDMDIVATKQDSIKMDICQSRLRQGILKRLQLVLQVLAINAA